MMDWVYNAGAWLGDIGITLVVFLLIFGLLIILHEFGHFWAARAAGVRVLEFGFGLPPKVWGKKTTRQFTNDQGEEKTETMEWTINAIPFGGFVRMHGEADKSNDSDAFGQRPLLWRMLVICGGVIMNFLIGWVLFTGLFLYGIDPNPQTQQEYNTFVEQGFIEEKGVYVVKIEKNSVAEQFGIKAGDEIIGINNNVIRTSQDVLDEIKEAENNTVELFLMRNDLPINIQVQLTDNQKLGVYPSVKVEILKKEQYGLLEAPQKAFSKCIDVMHGSLTLLGDVVKKLTSTFELPDEIGGPVAIADTTHSLLEIGDMTRLIAFAAMLSLSLAVINIMPFPGLDGGRFVFLLLEALLVIKAWIFRNIFRVKKNLPTKVPDSWEMPFHLLGYILLMGLLLWITFKDIVRIFF